jgi:two-component system, OmpR family, alkaline phosphatase synthesis response regulator PhoP
VVKRKILIVDDSEVVLTVARVALEEEGYEVFTASDGIKANNYLFSREKLDLVIMDVMLPMLDGDKKVKLLKDKEMYSHTPFLLISSKSAEQLKQLTVETGANGYLQKPFSKAELVACVQSLLDN